MDALDARASSRRTSAKRATPSSSRSRRHARRRGRRASSRDARIPSRARYTSASSSILPVGRSPPRGAILEATRPRSRSRAALRTGSTSAAGSRARASMSCSEGIELATGRPTGRDRAASEIAFATGSSVAVGRGASGVRRSIVLGVVLGEDEGLSDDVQDDFRASGLYHLLAVSGQNVAFLAAGVFLLGWLFRLSRALRELATLGVIAAYVLAVGWQPSVARAAVAGALASLAWLASRPRDRWHFFAVGALVLMAWMPTSLLEPGFQLSFAAVAAIFVAVPRVRRKLDGLPLPPALAEALAVALSCGLATAPIVLVHFGQAPVYTVPANVARVPGRSARARLRAPGRGGRSGLSLGRRWALGARGLGGSVAGARRTGRRRFASRASGCPRRARTRDRLGRRVARRSTGTTKSLVAAASGGVPARGRRCSLRRGVGRDRHYGGVEPTGRLPRDVPGRRTRRLRAARDASGSSPRGRRPARSRRGRPVDPHGYPLAQRHRSHASTARSRRRRGRGDSQARRRAGSRAGPPGHGAGERGGSGSRTSARRFDTCRAHGLELPRGPPASQRPLARRCRRAG